MSYRPDLSGGVGVLPRQTEVQHVALPVGGGEAAHRKVGLQEETGGKVKAAETPRVSVAMVTVKLSVW